MLKSQNPAVELKLGGVSLTQNLSFQNLIPSTFQSKAVGSWLQRVVTLKEAADNVLLKDNCFLSSFKWLSKHS